MLRIRDLVFHTLLLGALATTGCDCGPGIDDPTVGGGGQGGQGGQPPEPLPCGIDCSTIQTPACTIAVCNTGQELGPINQCVVVTAPSGTACDDGVYCTMGDSCQEGICTGTEPNDCGLEHSPCEAVLCEEATQSCTLAPVNDGTACQPEDLCRVNGICQLGECLGEPKNCEISPLAECNAVECEPATGDCVATPDPDKDFNKCVLTGDPCQVDKTCLAGECGGGSPKDCSALDGACEVGVCDGPSGACTTEVAPAGSACGGDSVNSCQNGFCDATGVCKAQPGQNGGACNDHDACTTAEVCGGGVCIGGTPVGGCTIYFKETFEVCPNGWTFGGDWECGTPTSVGPAASNEGWNVVATKIAGLYSVNQSYSTTVADSPSINLTAATAPVLSFWAWEHTEGGSFDGWNIKVSTDNGQSYNQLPLAVVTPAYPLTVGGQPAWGGNNAAAGWRNFQADLSAFAGQTIKLRFAFRSDGAAIFPGVYLDDLFITEPLQSPLYITGAAFPTLYTGVPVSIPMSKVGGTAAVTWSIVPGGVNTDWLAIDPVTGVLSGTPTATDVGPVSVTVRVEQTTFPSNYDEVTFDGTVKFAAYYTSFEGACPSGWTLTGDWGCGVPSVLGGPVSAFDGSQCIGNSIDSYYAHDQQYSTSQAISPPIDLSDSPFPTLTFRMYVDIEPQYEGVNLKVSNDGGMTWTVVDTIVPPYAPFSVDGEQAWSGWQVALGWQQVTANLAQYIGQTIQLKFSFTSDGANNGGGYFIDDFLVQ